MLYSPSPRTDVLGPGYLRQDILVSDRWNPDLAATLVSPPDQNPDNSALLWVHGFNDYYFHSHVAERLERAGISCYGIDLRRYGRAWRPGQWKCFAGAMEDYYSELDQAIGIIRREHGHRRVILAGHSTGGLLAALYAHDRRGYGVIDALMLNSPWLDETSLGMFTAPARGLIAAASRLRPSTVVKPSPLGVYGKSLHVSYGGEWDYNLQWKTIEADPVRLAWLQAVLRGQKRIRQGMDIDVPVVMYHSDQFRSDKELTENSIDVDQVLDVENMRKLANTLGRNVQRHELKGASHDVSLSRSVVREQFFDHFVDWLGTV